MREMRRIKQLLSQEIDKEFQHLCMIELKVDHMTGKEAIELVQMRQ